MLLFLIDVIICDINPVIVMSTLMKACNVETLC